MSYDIMQRSAGDLELKAVICARKAKSRSSPRIIRLIRSLLKSLLVVAIFVPVATCLPLATSLCRTPDGAMVVFWLGPWNCCFGR